MSVNWYNPYALSNGRWFKGNLHAHCLPESPCANIHLETLLDGYQQKSYDFLSVSDHLAVTLPKRSGMTFIPGLEWNSRAGYMPNHIQTQHDHIGVYGEEEYLVKSSMNARTLPELLNGNSRKMLKIANHPDWLAEEHFDLASLMRYAEHLDGMEIYNYSIEADVGQADTTWKWDRLLSMGYPLLGFAHDDSHSVVDIGKAWLMVKSEFCSPPEILQALKAGNFYCSTGVYIDVLERHRSTVSIALREESLIRVIGSFGRTLMETSAAELHWSFEQEDTEYVRFHVRNGSWQQAWSQPFFQNWSEPRINLAV